jgi:Fe2+ or Zn2+ uptake regulation protein
MSDELKELKEVNQRVTRIETRLLNLGTKMGYDLKEEDHVHVDVEKCTVTIDVMDVTVSSVVNKARQAGLHGKRITVEYKGQTVAIFKV